jgi:ATP-dependent RNA helicase DDX56/DBP9
VIYALIRLKIISGKAIIFVNDIDRCYALKLFLERFSINSAVLNAELPQNSRFIYSSNAIAVLILVFRYHIVQEFNKGIFDYLIATDENFHEDDDDDDEGDNDEGTHYLTSFIA